MDRLRDREAFKRHSMVGPPEVWREKRQFQIDFLISQGLQPHHKLLDVGCGTLRGGIPLIDYLDAGNYTGTEVRREVLDEARKELERSRLTHKNPTLITSDDFTTLQCDTMFDYAWAFSVLIHMTDEIVKSCLGFVSSHLQPDGAFYANAGVGPRRDQTGHRGFPVIERPLDQYEDFARSAGLRVEELGTLKDLGHVTGRGGDMHQMLRFSPA